LNIDWNIAAGLKALVRFYRNSLWSDIRGRAFEEAATGRPRILAVRFDRKQDRLFPAPAAGRKNPFCRKIFRPQGNKRHRGFVLNHSGISRLQGPVSKGNSQ
jgi:hypothetical protein